MKFQHIPPHHGFWPLLTWSYTIKALNPLRLLGSDWLFPGFLPILLKLIYLLSVKSICKVEAAHCGSSCFVCVKCAIKFFLFGLISPNLSMIFRYGGKWTKITSCAKRCGHFGCNFGWMNTSWIGWNIVRGILRQSVGLSGCLPFSSICTVRLFWSVGHPDSLSPLPPSCSAPKSLQGCESEMWADLHNSAPHPECVCQRVVCSVCLNAGFLWVLLYSLHAGTFRNSC